MNRNQELSYRTLSQLIDTSSVDLRSYYSDGIIETAELIKVALKCNYELGLQINQTKETILDVEHFRTKLPADFQFLNFAMLCTHWDETVPSVGNGLVKTEHVIPIPSPNLTTCPCWTVQNLTSGAVQTKYLDCAANPQGLVMQPLTTISLCANSVTQVPGLDIFTKSFCYNDPQTAQYTCTLPINCGCDVVTPPCNAQPNPDPWNQNKVYTICNDTIGIQVTQECRFFTRHYTRFEELYMEPCRRASAFSSNNNFRLRGNIAILRDNYLEIARECATVYINYQGMLEDDNHELLVLDHPLINMWYEYEIKKRILENLYINGEPDIERRLQYVANECKTAKAQAMAVAYMPDFQTIKETYNTVRRFANEKFSAPFSRYWGIQKLSAEFDYQVNGRYRE